MRDQAGRTGPYQRKTGCQARYKHGNQSNRGQKKERVLFIQLAICLVLFLTAFIGKGIFPDRLVQFRSDVLAMISADFDWREAMADLGESLSQGDSILSDLGDFCVEVFGVQEQPQSAAPVEFQPVQPASVLTAELNFFSREPDILERTEHYSGLSKLGVVLDEPPEPQPEVEKAEENAAFQGAIMPAGNVFQLSDYSGPVLPDNYTMDVLSLGGLEITTPLMGHLTSPYGYRTNPVNGAEGDFHGGVDISGQTGDAICAFASGRVEYTGRDDSYGLYFQIDHGNGIKSFYAHCSQVLVKKGQQVNIGDTVALVGATGTVTGPHLHLELKYEKMHINPAYYVQFLNDQ